jgi:hypothetical protein
MEENLRQRLISSLPTKVRIDSSMDYPDQGYAKVRGVTAKCGFTLTYDYWDNPDTIKLQTFELNDRGFDGEIPLEELNDYLS